jgi:tetratricopeptide (TPR) repeat protein
VLRLFLFVFFITLIDTVSCQSAQGTDSIIRISKSLPDDTTKCNILNSIAHRLCTENPEKALGYCHQALELSRRINYKKGKADALNLTGLYFYFSGEFDKAIDFLIKGYNLHDSLNNIEGKSTSANYLGNLYFSKGDISNNKNDYQRALEYFEQSYELSKKCNDSIGMSSSLNNRGTIAKRFGNYKEAERLIYESIKIRELLNDRYGLSTSFTNLANMYEERNEFDRAIEFNLKAFNILGKDVTEYDNAITNLNIGGLYLKKKKYPEGLVFVKKGYESAQKFESLELVTDACLRLSEAYKMNGDHKNALVLYEQYSKTKDSLLNSENNSQITKLQMLYETEKKNKAIALLNKTNELKESELERASLWRKVYIFGIIFLAIVSFVIASLIYNRYKIKNEANVKLQAYNDEIEFQKKALEEKNKEITDSIRYARRIQQSLLPNEKLIEKSLNPKGNKIQSS